jgi:hypothetical protein
MRRSFFARCERAPIAVLAVLAGCLPRGDALGRAGPELERRREIWALIEPRAKAHGLDPLFVYALVGEESNFDPGARKGEARGLLQLKPQAWRSVSMVPYEPAVWDEQTNLEVAIDRLTGLKADLEARGVFSYGLLWAAHHYGLEYVAAHGFKIERLPRPSEPIARAFWEGRIHPLDPPK